MITPTEAPPTWAACIADDGRVERVAVPEAEPCSEVCRIARDEPAVSLARLRHARVREIEKSGGVFTLGRRQPSGKRGVGRRFTPCRRVRVAAPPGRARKPEMCE